MGLETTFMIIGGVIVAGFFAQLFFLRTKIPDVLPLMILGALLGPVYGFIQAEPLIPMMAFIGAIALLILTFDGGMDLNFFKVLKEIPKATSFTLLIVTLSTVSTAMFTRIALGWDWIHGLLLGVIIAGTSAEIIMAIINKLRVSDEAKLLIELESVINDAFCIVGAITIIQIINSTALNVSDALHSLSSNFSIAIVVGLIFGLVWIGTLRQFYGKPFGYLLTLAVVFILYGLVEYMRGNGVIAALMFGIVLGNSGEIAKMFRMDGEYLIDKSIKAFQFEVSFFVKTFFFVYLGLIFDLKSVNNEILLVSGGLVIALLAARYVGVRLFTEVDQRLKGSEFITTTMFPRGLATAVLASLPVTQGIEIPGFIEIVFLVVIMTNVISTAGAFYFERRMGPEVVSIEKKIPTKR